jgi:hypothetical protein
LNRLRDLCRAGIDPEHASVRAVGKSDRALADGDSARSAWELRALEHGPVGRDSVSGIERNSVGRIGLDVEIKAFRLLVPGLPRSEQRDRHTAERRDDPGNRNFDVSYFDNASVNHRIHAAARLPAPARYGAFARLERDILSRYAPVAASPTASASRSSRDASAVSPGTPSDGLDYAALCLRR